LECIRADRGAGQAKARRIGEVKRFRAELQFHTLSDGEVLEKREVDFLSVGPKQNVVALVSFRSKVLSAESRGIEPSRNVIRGCSGRDCIRTIGGDAQRILFRLPTQNREWLAGSKRINAIKLPPFCNLTKEAVGLFCERQFVIRRDDKTVLNHVVAGTVIAGKIVEHLRATRACAAAARTVCQRF
jgi:hypothetical protein